MNLSTPFAPRRSSRSLLICVGLVITATAYFLIRPPSGLTATTFTVNSTIDSVDALPGDGVCADLLARCTLRAAVMESNALAGADTIIVPAGVYTLTLFAQTTISYDNERLLSQGARQTGGDLDIVSGDLAIIGASPATTIIQAGAAANSGIDRVFDVNNPRGGGGIGINVTLENLTIRNGNSPAEPVPNSPNPIRHNGGAIKFDGFNVATGLPKGKLTIRNCNINGSQAAGTGGGISLSFGSLDIDGTQISSNSSLGGSGGGIMADAGGQAANQSLTITNSTLSGNTANNALFGSGGGMFASGNAPLTIDTSHVVGNSAGVDGGGIAAIGFSAANVKTITKTRIENNSSGSRGDGVFSGNSTASISALVFTLNVVVGNNSGGGDATATGLYSTVNTADDSVVNNWWGCNEGPTVSPCDRIGGAVGFGSGPYLVLHHAATPNAIETNQSTSLQADFFQPSSGAVVAPADLVALNGRAIAFNNAVLGLITAADTQISGGKANATYTAGPIGGSGSADATVDHATATAYISIEQAPTIICPENITTTTDEGLCSASVTFAANATGFPAPTITYRIGATVITSGHTFPQGSTTVTAEASNGVGEDATCSFTVTVTDDEAPSITCPSNITTTSEPGSCGAVVNYTAPTGADNCPGATTTQTAGLASGSTFPVGTTTNTFKVTDASGNEAECSFTVTVEDDENPVVTVPANVVTTTDPGTCSAAVTFSATATDNCSGVTVVNSPASGSTFPLGTTTVTSTATDASGNQDVKTFTVTVNDDEAPVISCPANIVVDASAGACAAQVNFTITATDNCDSSVSTGSSPASGSMFPVGTTTVNATATDDAGNTSSCTFTVTVVDNESPTITCPANITTTSDPELCGAVVNYTAPVGTDSCPGATTTQIAGLPSGSTFPVGTTTNTFKVTDAAGHEASCSFTVTVEDDENPVVTVPANIVTTTDPETCSAVVTFSATATDNCSVASVVSSPASGSTFPKGTTTVTVTATDASGNQDVETFTVTVNDDEAPAITCPANIVVDAPEGECSAQVNFTITASDNCPGTVTTGSSPASGSMFPVGTTTVNATATDASGNTATCTFTVTVRDATAPTITLTGTTPVLWPPGHQYETINLTDLVASASDECDASIDISDVVIAEVSSDEVEDGPADGSTLNDIVIAADCKSVQLRAERQANGNGRVYTITFKVTDSSGNMTSKTAQVLVPKNGANGGAVNGPGPGYSVTSACP